MSIDDVSQALGSLQAEVRQGNQDRLKLFATLEELSSKLDVHTDKFSIHAIQEGVLHEKVNGMVPEIEKLKKARWVGLGLIGGGSLLGGVGGSHLPQWIKWAIGTMQ